MARRGTTARIDLEELGKLCAMQATDEEIAAWFGVSTRTIERRRKVRRFAEAMERGRAKGRLSIRRMQIKLLEQGNATMGVWLGKNILGQTDQVNYNVNGGAGRFILLPVQTSDWPADPDDGPVIDITPGSPLLEAPQSPASDGEQNATAATAPLPAANPLDSSR